MEDGAVCEPNISAAGVRRRRLAGLVCAGLTVALVIALSYFQVAWYWRAFAFLPAAIAGVSMLQASRRTCVARAREGTLEADDFSTSPAAADAVAKSRKVAASIQRDGFLVGLACTALACATALVH